MVEQTAETFSFCVTQTLYLLNSSSLFFPPPSPWRPPFYFIFLWVLLLNGVMQHPSRMGFFHLTQCPPGSVMLQHMTRFLSFSRLNNIPLYVFILPLSIHPSLSRHLSGSTTWLLWNNVAMNVGVWICLWDAVFNSLGYRARTGVAGSYGSATFHFFQELPYCLPWWLHHFTAALIVCKGFNFSTFSLTLVIFCWGRC